MELRCFLTYLDCQLVITVQSGGYCDNGCSSRQRAQLPTIPRSTCWLDPFLRTILSWISAKFGDPDARGVPISNDNAQAKRS